MKYFLIISLLAIILLPTKATAQMNNYNFEWTAIDKALQKGLTQTANTTAQKVFALASKEKNTPQVIKAAMYLVGFRNNLIEESELSNHFFLDTLIAKNTGAAKAILQSMQAELLHNYLQQNRWRFYNRTETVQELSNNIQTWSIDKLTQTIAKGYLNSLKDATTLQAMPTTIFEPIVIKGFNTSNLRTTVYDILAHRALAYCSNTESYITKPAYYFEINQAQAFASATDFVKHKFTTKDTASNHYKALQIYQALLAFRINNGNADALVDADLLRLQFVYNHSTHENKNELYQSALENLTKQNPKNVIAANAYNKIAQLLTQNNTPENKVANYAKAISMYNSNILLYPKAEAGIDAKNRLHEINTKELRFNIESVSLPNEPQRILLQHKNIKQAYINIYKTTKEDFEKLIKLDDEQYYTQFAKTKPFLKTVYNLPQIADYTLHSVEAKIDALPVGMYIIIVSEKEDGKPTNNIIGRSTFQVSNISFIKKENEIHVLHRNTGAALSNAKVTVWKNEYNQNSRKYENKLSQTLTTNQNGYCKITTQTNDYNNYTIAITHNNENFENEQNFYNYNDYYNEKKIEKSFLFTDRSIYRLGQIVYFKGIVIIEKSNPYGATVVANKKTTVQLYDANHQKVTSLNVTTNDYGSYNGNFTLPTTGLNGQFYIKDSTNNTIQYIQVEEYKRPKFSVAIAQPKGTYKVNDSVKITGTAKAFAGNNIDGAKVKYNVKRKTSYPIWYGFYNFVMSERDRQIWNEIEEEDKYDNSIRGGKQYSSNNENVEITNGEIITNEKGEFTITFKAKPDATTDKKWQPIFNYEVVAEVTDINGETRIGMLNVPVSYQALKIELPKIEQLDKNKLQKILVQTQNINGDFEAAPVTINMYALDAPKQFFRERYWQSPDQFLYTEQEFHQWFPNDLYKEENKKQSWKQLQKVFSTTATTKLNEPISLLNQQFVEGHYIIEALATDKYGETVKEIMYVELTGNTPTNFNNAITIKNDKALYKPNEKASFTANTLLDNVFAIHDEHYMTDRNNKSNEKENISNANIIRKYITFTNKQYKNEITVTDADRGGINNEICFVKNNRFYQSNNTINIPWSNKELNIQFNTFRDKTLPGSQEEYSVKITGDSGQKVAAEMLATMYDASLDQILPHSINKFISYPSLFNTTYWTNGSNFNDKDAYCRNYNNYNYLSYNKVYDAIGIKVKKLTEPLWWLNPLDYAYSELPKRTVRSFDKNEVMKSAAPMAEKDMSFSYSKLPDSVADKFKTNMKDSDGDGVVDEMDNEPNTPTGTEVNTKGQTLSENIKEDPKPQPRKNFNETAFFLPDLKTDAEGNIIFKYTIPEALTEWKLLALAHTKDLAIGTTTKKVITQKPLMVQPNLPRFVREGDKLNLAVKVVNLSDKEVTGTSQLELIDATTNQSVDGWFKNMYANQYFTIAAGQSTVVNFAIEIPFNYNKPLIIRTSAITKDSGVSKIPPLGGGGASSDAEENIVPVVTNRMLVTETMPLPMKGVGTKTFKFEKLLQSAKSESLTNQNLTVEYTSNPAWYAVQALPYLIDYPYDCAEQTFSKYYANAIASKIANSNPKIKTVFDKWATTDSKELVSNLSKNQELKTALLEETPWVMDAQNETQQKKNIALLFDLNKMALQLKNTLQKLNELQLNNGGFAWFKGGRDDRYITQYILTGIGHLKKIGALDEKKDMELLINKALPYLDDRMKDDYNDLIKTYKTETKIPNGCGNYQLQYLYMRSFFPEKIINLQHEKAYLYFINQADKNWLQQSKYMQAMTALIMHRNNKKIVATNILKSLKENAIVNEELGMYWKDVVGGYYWHQAPIETMSLMVEAFNEVGTNIDDVNNLRTWLIKNKQTSNWKTTKATAEACYAFLLNGTDLLSNTPNVEIKLGNIPLSLNSEKEEGTGYFKTSIIGEKVKPEMGNITVVLTNKSGVSQIPPSGGGGASWGGVYWQYFEDLDKIKGAETPLKLQKKIFKEIQTDKGKKLSIINENDAMQVGDKMIVRIELKVDRDMEYIHMKDMRSSGTEPVNVISQYKWQDGLGYYETTKDVSTNFFFNYLPKGTYVFEYPLFVSHKGNFSNGVTTIQCMYAPEFSSHSEGVRVNVE